MAEGSFTFLTKEEFEQLPQGEKIAYIDRAVRALNIAADSPDIFKNEGEAPESPADQ